MIHMRALKNPLVITWIHTPISVLSSSDVYLHLSPGSYQCMQRGPRFPGDTRTSDKVVAYSLFSSQQLLINRTIFPSFEEIQHLSNVILSEQYCEVDLFVKCKMSSFNMLPLVILALRRLLQEDRHTFEANLGEGQPGLRPAWTT